MTSVCVFLCDIYREWVWWHQYVYFCVIFTENESDDISMCSEEEQDIMAEIRAEITEKVRDEMKSELKLYQQAKDNLNKDTAAHATDEHLIGEPCVLCCAMLKI